MPFNIYHNLEKYYWIVTGEQKLGAHIKDTAFNIMEYDNIDEGNNVPTIVIPGFSKGNSSTFFMRKVLDLKGHNINKWCVKTNNGFSDHIIEETKDQVKLLADQYGCPVNIVGQSVGGCFGRIVANDIPDEVNSIITLGTPINGIELIDRSFLTDYDEIVGIRNGSTIHHMKYFEHFNPNPPIPTTSVYSKTDGLVNWKHSHIEESDISENVETNSTHYAMGFHLETIRIIANRLSFLKKNWKKWG